MKSGLASVLLLIGFIVLLGVISYISWGMMIPMRIGEKIVDRKITQQSQQYIETQRSALVTMYASYTSTEDETHRAGIKVQMCDIANKIPSSEIPTSVLSVVRSCI